MPWLRLVVVPLSKSLADGPRYKIPVTSDEMQIPIWQWGIRGSTTFKGSTEGITCQGSNPVNCGHNGTQANPLPTPHPQPIYRCSRNAQLAVVVWARIICLND